MGPIPTWPGASPGHPSDASSCSGFVSWSTDWALKSEPQIIFLGFISGDTPDLAVYGCWCMVLFQTEQIRTVFPRWPRPKTLRSVAPSSVDHRRLLSTCCADILFYHQVGVRVFNLKLLSFFSLSSAICQCFTQIYPPGFCLAAAFRWLWGWNGGDDGRRSWTPVGISAPCVDWLDISPVNRQNRPLLATDFMATGSFGN